ncbi:MAG: hypothetical protein Q8J88_10605 [Bacteroidales bacterium]|nr:hypothetical protein [Bacteroidales bacterium]
MKTFLHIIEQLARKFRERLTATKKVRHAHPLTWHKIKILWLLVRVAIRRFKPQPPSNAQLYVFTIDLRKLQQIRFHTIAGSNAPPEGTISSLKFLNNS